MFNPRRGRTIEATPGEKLGVIVDPATCWEYRCEACEQLRLQLSNEKPVECGDCGADSIIVGRPGELPA